MVLTRRKEVRPMGKKRKGAIPPVSSLPQFNVRFTPEQMELLQAVADHLAERDGRYTSKNAVLQMGLVDLARKLRVGPPA
jgi:hypothetical protein